MRPIEGVCDFCFSGMGVRELDIRMYVGQYRDAFTSGYDSVSDVPLNTANIDILAEVGSVFKTLYKTLEGQSQEEIGADGSRENILRAENNPL